MIVTGKMVIFHFPNIAMLNRIVVDIIEIFPKICLVTDTIIPVILKNFTALFLSNFINELPPAFAGGIFHAGYACKGSFGNST